MIQHRKFSVTTSAGGAGADTQDVIGSILAIHTDATAADTAGCDVTWTIPANAARGSVAETVLTLTDLGDASAVDYPRRTVDSNVGAALSTAGDLKVEPYIATGSVTMTVASGGATKVYTGSVWYDDGR